MAKMVCKNCGYVGEGKQGLQGHWSAELVLWMFLIVPGIIYTIWRHFGPPVCPTCKKQDMIPADSPMGKKLIADHSG